MSRSFFLRLWLYVRQTALWFSTLPSLDKSLKMPDGSTLHPSRGTIGSAYQTADGQYYVRTGRGSVKVNGITGGMLIRRAKRIRNEAIRYRIYAVACFAIVCLVLSTIVV